VAEDEAILFRINPDGQLDSTFGTLGVISNEFGLREEFRSIALQPDGKILVGASKRTFRTFIGSFMVFRYFQNGMPDHSFGQNGSVECSGFESFPRSIGTFIQPDGRIIHAGISGKEVVLLRHLNDISLDTEEPTSFHLSCKLSPQSESISISWEQKGAGNVHCELFDVQGKLLQILIPSKHVAPGQHQQEIPILREYPVGIYYVVFSTGTRQQSVKLLKAQ
jgi:uncharacterized delta-60 repeat protein